MDPLAGSYYVESLTSDIEKRASQYLKKIDDMGGMLKAIENGFVFREIQDSAVKYQKQINSGEKVVVGLNKFVMEEEDMAEHDIFEFDPEVEKLQKEKVAAIKARRSSKEVRSALEDLGKAIDRDKNLMPSIIKTVKSYATIGEICDVMREKWGEFQPSTYI